uniref:uncharacterized protein LOC105352334 n=1 Tax=Fragaria vesca subsp. vesca TaxID=101020 RepID=UPI0005C962E4|nr:PREDICTED: uncharacterized protein LOC105352334 [Fragaria vesca subsp. vesca]
MTMAKLIQRVGTKCRDTILIQTRKYSKAPRFDYLGTEADWSDFYENPIHRQSDKDDRCIYYATKDNIEAEYLRVHGEKHTIDMQQFYIKATEGKGKKEKFETVTALRHAKEEGLVTRFHRGKNDIIPGFIKIQAYKQLNGRNKILQACEDQSLIGEIVAIEEFRRQYKGEVFRAEDALEEFKRESRFWCPECKKLKQKPFNCPTCARGMYEHCLVITGYDATGDEIDHHLTVRNSWGKSWGEQGYGRLHLCDTGDMKRLREQLKMQGILNVEARAWRVTV